MAGDEDVFELSQQNEDQDAAIVTVDTNKEITANKIPGISLLNKFSLRETEYSLAVHSALDPADSYHTVSLKLYHRKKLD